MHVVHALAVPLVATPYEAYELSVPSNLFDDLRRAAQEKLEQTRKAIEAKGVSTVTAQVVHSQDAVGRSPMRCARTEPTSS